jgi:hypothetical protein
MQRYLRIRGAARDTAKLADWDGYLSGIDLDLRPPEPYLVIENSALSAPLQDQAQALIAKVLEK